ncbi:MAG TPA: hypothetical protein VFN24_05915 [Microbacterium sp.]|nr:hypothetical protein [Microbacterium sp.]
MSPDAVSPPPTDVEARLAALETENARLRDQLGRSGGEGAEPRPTRRGRWRAVLSAVCIVLASVMVTVSIVGSWARVQLVDESRFVETFAPLAEDPAVQAMVIDGVATAVDEKVDFQGVTDDLFDGIASLGLPPRAAAAIDMLRVPAAQGLENLVVAATTRLVQSDAFTAAWQTGLQASHRVLVRTAAGGGDVVTISGTGELGIELGPIIAQVKQRLADQGIGIASLIPEIDRTIVVAQSDALVTVGVVYNLAVVVGWWLPILALALFIGGILLARRRSVAVLGSGIGLAAGAGILAIALTSVGAFLPGMALQLGLAPAALIAVYEQVIDAMLHTAIVLTVVGLIVAVLAWVLGRSRAAQAVRGGVGSINTGLRRSIARRGVDTGAFGAWMYAQRVLVRSILIVLLVVWLLLLRPLGLGDVLLVLLVGLVVWWLCELVQRRPGEPVETGAPAETVEAAEAAESGVPQASAPSV